jgi:very-short-patch-repair endonuclease
MSERRTLGVSRAAAPKADAREGFALTGARLDKLKERARDLRRNPSDAHQALWERLSDSKVAGVKFTRHAVVGSAIADFACPSRWIVVQISPEGMNADVAALQDRKLTDVGIRVLRFDEALVLSDLVDVVATIGEEANLPFDPRAARRGRTTSAPRFESTEG